MAKEFLLGCSWRGVRNSQAQPTMDEQFRMIKDAGVFDYLDRVPVPELADEYQRCAEKYGVPIHTGSATYTLGRDEALIETNLRTAARLGLKVHNMMVFTHHADGHILTVDEVVESYLRNWELGERIGVQPAYELHVNMWSEDYRKVRPVAEKVRSRGIPFNFTMDYSHCAFKIDNPEEQELFDIRKDVEAGKIVLDPFEPGSLCEEWLKMNMTVWAQFRPVAPNGPKNTWAKDEKGNPGRGIQYPFMKPRPGEWHTSQWHAWKLQPSKEFLRRVLRHHLTEPASPLRFITTEMIDLPDYGDNAKYSIFEHNTACARWIRDTWSQLKAMHAAGIPLAVS